MPQTERIPQATFSSFCAVSITMPEGAAGPLAEERRHYEQIKAGLLEEHEGKFALIKGDKFIGAYDTPQTAYEEGINRFGNEPMLIIRILREEPRESMPAYTLGVIRASLQG